MVSPAGLVEAPDFLANGLKTFFFYAPNKLFFGPSPSLFSSFSIELNYFLGGSSVLTDKSFYENYFGAKLVFAGGLSTTKLLKFPVFLLEFPVGSE